MFDIPNATVIMERTITIDQDDVSFTTYRKIIRLGNGYVVSIARSPFTGGYSKNEYDVAILGFEEDYDIVYDRDTTFVMSALKTYEVMNVLIYISKLKLEFAKV